MPVELDPVHRLAPRVVRCEGDMIAGVPVLCGHAQAERSRREQAADGLQDREPVVGRQSAAGQKVRLDVDQKERGAIHILYTLSP